MKNMKPITIKAILCCCICIIACWTFSTFADAAESVSFALDAKEAPVNRLIEVGVRASSSRRLSAALFTFRYDTKLLEFREVIAPKDAKTVCHAADSTVTVSYLCTQGAELSGNPVLFSLSFKTLTQGSTSVGFTVKECVDAETVEFMPIGSCTEGVITIGSAAAVPTERTAAVKATKATKTPSKPQKQSVAASSPVPSNGDDENRLTDLGTINSVYQQEPDKLTPLIVLCVSVAAGIIFAVYFVYRIKTDRNNKNRNDRSSS